MLLLRLVHCSARIVEVGSSVEPRDSHLKTPRRDTTTKCPRADHRPSLLSYTKRTVSPCFDLSDALALALLVLPMSCHVMSCWYQEQASQPHSSLDTCPCGFALRLFRLLLFHGKVISVRLVRGRVLVRPASGHECAGWLTSCAVARCNVCWSEVDYVLAFGMLPVLVLFCWGS
jgi:hypothetical protein